VRVAVASGKPIGKRKGDSMSQMRKREKEDG